MPLTYSKKGSGLFLKSAHIKKAGLLTACPCSLCVHCPKYLLRNNPKYHINQSVCQDSSLQCPALPGWWNRQTIPDFPPSVPVSNFSAFCNILCFSQEFYSLFPRPVLSHIWHQSHVVCADYFGYTVFAYLKIFPRNRIYIQKVILLLFSENKDISIVKTNL